MWEKDAETLDKQEVGSWCPKDVLVHFYSRGSGRPCQTSLRKNRVCPLQLKFEQCCKHQALSAQ